MKHQMAIEYLKRSADLNFGFNFGVNGAIETIATKWELTLFGKWIVFINNIITF